MKFFACVVFAAVLAAAVAEGEREERSSYAAAPAYSAPATYSAPAKYSAPVHAGPAHSYTYSSPAPYVPCGKNLLFSCAPSVAPVPCSAPSYSSSYSAPSYSAPSYSAPTGAYSQYAPTYAYPAFAPTY